MKTTWTPFDLTTAPAETILTVRAAGGEPVNIIINGHRQILAAHTRQLLDLVPAEIEVPDTTAKLDK